MKWGYVRAVKDFRRRYLIRVLRAAELSVPLAAKMAGVHRTSFYAMCKSVGVSPGLISLREIHKVGAYDAELAKFSRRFLVRALARANGSPAKCARAIGINRTHVYRLAKRFAVVLLRPQEVHEGNDAWRALSERPLSNSPNISRRPAFPDAG